MSAQPNQQPSDSLAGPNGEPHRIGRYTLSREIGKGSFAVVFKGYYNATPPSSPRPDAGSVVESTPRTTVAIKVVTRRKLTAKLMENLEGEISILKAIHHPNVVELIDCLKTDSHIYLVMAFCSAGDLSLYIRKKGILAGGEKESVIYDAGAARLDGPHGAMGASGLEMYPHPEEGGLNLDVARSFLSQLAAAMEFMRERNIVHRDIKPQNLLLSPPDMACLAAGHPRGIHQLKVADFGFARNLPAASLAETLCGSPLYMAPEILRYEKYDAKADLWSVGAVLYEMVVGKPPFRASNHVELARKIERGEDRIRFPDERSPASLAREKERREELGERDVEIKRPQVVADDIKALIRTLLKRKPVERLSFDDFFRSPVIEGVRQGNRERAARILRAQEEAEAKKAAEVQARAQAQARQAQEAAAAVAAAAAPPSASSKTVPPAPFARTQPVLLRSKYVVSRPGSASRQPSGSTAADSVSSPGVGGGAGLHPRRPSSLSETPPLYNPVEPSSLEDNVPQTPGASVTDLVSGGGVRGAAVEIDSGSATPGGKGGDSSGQGSEELLGKEYVMVEKRNVEVNALADQLAASPSAQRRASSNLSGGSGKEETQQQGTAGSLGRRPSRLSRFGSGLSVAAAAAWNANAGVTSRTAPSTSPSDVVQITNDGASNVGVARLGSTPPSSAPFALPPGARRPSFHRRLSSSNSGSNSPGSRLSMVQRPSPPSSAPATTEENQGDATQQQLMTNGHKRAVPVPVPSNKHFARPTGSPSLAASSLPAAFSTSAGSSSHAVGTTGYLAGGQAGSASGPSSALARAISMASVRLFGVPSGMSLRGAAALVRGHGSRRAALLRSGEYADGAEAGLVATLEDLGQKAFVLSEFADSKLAAFFPTGPHQASSGEGESPSEANLGSAGGAFSASSGLGLGHGSLSRSASSGGAHRPGMRRASSGNSSAASGSPGTNLASPTIPPSEAAAAEALVLYVKSLSFLQRGIETTKLFIETRRTSSTTNATPTSPELNEAVQLLRNRFNEGYDKADFARARCGEFPESAKDVERLIFDKALEIARSAALDELENNREGSPWSAERCLLAYETASTMLLALLDPGEEGLGLDEAAVATVEKFVRSINKRLAALQRRVTEGSPTGVV